MYRLTAILFSLICFSNSSYSQYKLDIEISEIRSNKGYIMLQLFDGKEKVLSQEQNPVKDNSCLFSFTSLTPVKYAVRYYHDENMNGKMETNLVGKPTEGYGFSNNVIGKFGPPPFEKWLFEINDDNKKIVLKPTY
jgi:uncharacterized protein (DUF2141 family)